MDLEDEIDKVVDSFDKVQYDLNIATLAHKIENETYNQIWVVSQLH